MYAPSYEFSNRQLEYLADIEAALNLHDAYGRVFPLELMFYQKVFHADCIVARPRDYPHRIVYSCRGSGKSDSISIDCLMVAKTFEHMKIPVSSTRLENSEAIIDWINFLVDNANIDFNRDRKTDTISRFPFNDTEVIQIPGGNPDAVRGNRTGFMVFDEFAFLKYRDQKKLWDGGRRCMSEGGQLSILSTANTRNDMYWQAYKQARDLGIKIYVWTLFPTKFYNHNTSIFEVVDDEYLEAYYAEDKKKMKRMCDDAYMSGMWDAEINFEVEADQAALPYWGLWPADRGLIPLCYWINLEELELDRQNDVVSFLRENQGRVEEISGTFFPESVLNRQCNIPVTYISESIRAACEEGDLYKLYVGGFDAGGKSNYAAMSIYEESDSGKYREVWSETMWHLDSPTQLERALELEKLFPGLWIWGVDTTGMGYQFAQFLDRESTRKVVGIDANKKVAVKKGSKKIRSTMARAAAFRFREGLLDGWIEMLDNRTIKDDALLIQAADLSSRTIKETEGVTHADRTWSSIFAVFAPTLDPVSPLGFASGTKKVQKEVRRDPLQAFPLQKIPQLPRKRLGRRS
ncbi:MAG: hypothetical protein HXS54_05875 [Theionarchaea archaeon]|nr:hypothetical protein [Theionarchaea archaeon]DBA34896.1 TPA_asm: terminase large subunit [Caudoviricetes sp. vir521]